MHFEVFKHTYFFLSLLRNNWRKPVFEGGPAFPWPRPQISLQKQKQMFSQANLRCLIKFTILPKDLAFLLQKCQHCSPIAPFHFHCFDDNHISSRSLYLCLVCFRRRLLFRRIIQALGRKTSRTFYFPHQRRFQKNIIIFELHWPKRPCTHKLHSKLKQFIIVFRPFREKL